MVSKVFKNNRFWAGMILAQFLLFYLFSKAPQIITLYSHFFEWQKNFHSGLFSQISFSIGDVLYLFFIGFLMLQVIQLFNRKRRNRAFNRLLISLNIFYFLYQNFWGMLYFQEPISNRLSQKEYTMDAYKKLALRYLELCKKEREGADENALGVFTIKDEHALQLEIKQRIIHLPQNILNGKNNVQNSAIKSSLFSSVMSYTGISGYFNPFTGEAQYNKNIPKTYQPFVMAHEYAHQVGFAREQEANLIAYLIGHESLNKDLRYSTHYFVLRSLINAIAQEDEMYALKLINDYSEKMKKDREFELNFREKHQGALENLFGLTNDLFLKSNQQDGSITYSYFLDLLIRYEKY